MFKTSGENMFCNYKRSNIFSDSKSFLKRQNDASRLGTANKKIRVCNKIQKSQLLEKMTLQVRKRKQNRHNNCVQQCDITLPNIKLSPQESTSKDKSYETSAVSSNLCHDDNSIIENPCGKRIISENKSSCTYMVKDKIRNYETFKCSTSQHLCNYSLSKFKSNTDANNIVDNLLNEANQFINCNGQNENNILVNELLSFKFKCFINATTKNNNKTHKISIDVDVINIIEDGKTIVNECVPLNKITKNVCNELCEKCKSDHCSCALEFNEKLNNNNVTKDSMDKEYLSSGISINTTSHPPVIFRKECPNNQTLNAGFLITNNKTAVINKDSMNAETIGNRTNEILHFFKTQDNYSCIHNMSEIKSNTQANNIVCKLLKKAKTSMPFNIPDADNTFINELLASELKYLLVSTTKNKIKSRKKSILFHGYPTDSSDEGLNFIENHENVVTESRACNKDVNKKSHISDEKCTENMFKNNIFSSNILPDGNEVLTTTTHVSEKMYVDISLPINNYNITEINLRDVKYTNTENLTSEVKNSSKKSAVKTDNNINVLTKEDDDGTVSKNIKDHLHTKYPSEISEIPIDPKCYQVITESSATFNNLYYYNNKTNLHLKEAIIDKDATPIIDVEKHDSKNDETFNCQKTQSYSYISNLISSKSNYDVNTIADKLLSVAKTFMSYNDLREENSLISELNSSKWKCTIINGPKNNITSNKISLSLNCTLNEYLDIDFNPYENNATATNKCPAFNKDLNESDLVDFKKIMTPNYVSSDDVEMNMPMDISRHIVADTDNIPKYFEKISDPAIENFISNNNIMNTLTQDDIGLMVIKNSSPNSNSRDAFEIRDKITNKINVVESKSYKKYKCTTKRTSKSMNSSVATKRKINSTDKNKINDIDIDSIVFENRSLINMMKNSNSNLDTVSYYTIVSPVIGKKRFITTDEKKLHAIDVENIISANKTLINMYNKQKSLGNK